MTSISPQVTDPESARTEQQTSNVALAVTFLEMASDGRAAEALDRFGAPDFRHHNAYFPDDGASLASAMDENARQNPEKVLEVKRTITEGPLVAVLSFVRHQPADPGAAVVHIFRIDDGRIHELWDVGQEIPADSPNKSGMF